MAAGGCCGLIAGPSETIILKQQAAGTGALATLRSVLSEGGIRALYRGTQFAMMRDAGFTAGFMALGPFATDMLHKNGQSELVSRLAGGMGAGVIAAIVTHPLDTLKTMYQKDYLRKTYPSFASALRAGGLFKGLSARGLRVIIGTIIISNVTDMLNRKLAAHLSAKAI
jgi:hypothetical protein